jgi:hypothetical protein
MSGWIGVDLDATLAKYDHWRGVDHIGEPIVPMLNRVKKWLKEGKTVKIFTARASVPDEMFATVETPIHEWCEKQGLPRLEVTCIKDFGMIELWDDRAVRVETNTGAVYNLIGKQTV